MRRQRDSIQLERDLAEKYSAKFKSNYNIKAGILMKNESFTKLSKCLNYIKMQTLGLMYLYSSIEKHSNFSKKSMNNFTPLVYINQVYINYIHT